MASTSKYSENLLDIGSGTGLLGLMFAQQHAETEIHAIEIDVKSAELTTSNFQSSPFENKFKSFNTSLQQFQLAHEGFYETIICNPPFFDNQLQSKNLNKNLAKHDFGLTKEELLQGIDKLLSEAGTLYLLLPPVEAGEFIKLASKPKINLSALVKVKNFEHSEPIRYMMRFERNSTDVQEDTICIYVHEKTYSNDFINLLKDYYLYLT